MLPFSRNRREPSVIMRADRAREAGQWQIAASLYRTALDRKPGNPPIWIQYGHALKESGNRAMAEAAYRTAIGYSPDDADAYLHLGHVLKLQGRTAVAQAVYRRALALNPSLADAARELRELERDPASANPATADLAMPAPSEALAIATISPTANSAVRRQLKRGKGSFISRADRAREAQQWDIAAEFYRKALDRNPDNPPIWVQYGHALKEFGNLPEAERAYRAAIVRDPSAADPYLHLGHVLKMQGKQEEAEAAYLRAFALDPRLPHPPEALRGLGWSETRVSELRRSSSAADLPFGQQRIEPSGSASAPKPLGGAPNSSVSHGPLEEAVRTVRESGLFDADWYRSTYPEIAASGLDPILHYLQIGAAEGRDPSRYFDTKAYCALYPDVAKSGVNPLWRYVVQGRREGRITGAAARQAGQRIEAPDLFELRGLQPRGRIAVVLHLFDPELWDEMRDAVARISQPFDLFVSLTTGSSAHLRQLILQAFPHAYVFDFEDHGRDIGTFLVFLESGVLFKYDLVCKLHTKRSPHRADGDAWRRALIAGVLGSSELVERIISGFDADPDLGMVVAEGHIYGGPDQWQSNETRLAQLLPRIGISPEVKHRRFPGGSIFWIRPFLLRTLAGLGLTLSDFDPEPLILDGGLGHAVERMFGLICEAAGMRFVEHTRLPEIPARPGTSSDVNLIAFYLPQFHPIPENDAWWGEGFTEWTNVSGAKPLFAGHRQPRLPADLGFYDLRLPEVRETQAELARRFGLSGFCYYYYWFNGRRILERPLDAVVASGKPDFPFLICWANEPWTRNWDGFSRDVLLPQLYEPGWVAKFARDIAPLLQDRRYFRLEGKPMLLVYRIGHIPDAAAAMRELRLLLRDQGVGEIHLAAGWSSFPDDGGIAE
jgi:lipopolysaccharide biosynthesis protein/tetratricopeptide (TPR) repeat protein